MDTPAPCQHAIIDWILAHGSPTSGFGPAGSITTEKERAALAVTGVNYDASTVGDLEGQTWSHDTYDEAQSHPGLWADIVPAGTNPDARGTYGHDAQTWFVQGENSRLTLTDVITGVIEAGQVGDLYWRIKVEEARDSPTT